MVQRGQGPAFAEETLDLALIRGALGANDLERDLALETAGARAPGEVHLAHAPHTELTNQPVVADAPRHRLILSSRSGSRS